MSKDAVISTRADSVLRKRLETFCAASGLNQSDAIRTLLAWALARSGSPRAQAALAVQSAVVAAIGRVTSEMQQRVEAVLRDVVGSPRQ